jgi:hypothetical protein
VVWDYLPGTVGRHPEATLSRADDKPDPRRSSFKDCGFSRYLNAAFFPDSDVYGGCIDSDRLATSPRCCRPYPACWFEQRGFTQDARNPPSRTIRSSSSDPSANPDELLKMKQFETLPKLRWLSEGRPAHFSRDRRKTYNHDSHQGQF